MINKIKPPYLIFSLKETYLKDNVYFKVNVFNTN